MKRIVVLTPADARHGFSLAGVRQRILSPVELHTVLVEYVADPATGVVVVDERLLTPAVHGALHILERRWPGLVVVLPSPGPAVRIEEDYALGLIRRAIGYQVRLTA